MAASGPAPILNSANRPFSPEEVQKFKPIAARLLTDNAAAKITPVQAQAHLGADFPRFQVYFQVVCKVRDQKREQQRQDVREKVAAAEAEYQAAAADADRVNAEADSEIAESRASAIRRALGKT